MVRVFQWMIVVCGCLFIQPILAVCPPMDFTRDCRVDLQDYAIFASYWLNEGIPADPEIMLWVTINEPSFTGEMSKYETTNAQYCEFLNAALASGDITVSDNNVLGASGSNGGLDFVGQVYYNLAGAGDTVNGATNGGAARINYSNGAFTVDGDFENHPVTYVSYYGATAFCSYYGYRLPTEGEWQAVADYNGTYTYGCGTTINNSIANYNYENSTHPYGTMIVGSFGAFGYGICDLAGNVEECTSTISGGLRVGHGGGWLHHAGYCLVSYGTYGNPFGTYSHVGFRVCRDANPILWVTVKEPGFTGEMSKYETTNAQYCQFLNAALASGDITVSGNNVLGASGFNSGADFVGKVYYELAGAGITQYGATNGGAARINYIDGSFNVDSDFENHPVTYVTWYGANAFCNYYGYRLPSEGEWQSVADYDGTYTYGCGATINNSIANYSLSTHPNGTTAVGSLGTYGYGMCDMAGNDWEWTSTAAGSYYILRGGSWGNLGSYSSVSFQHSHFPYHTWCDYGFRVCR